MGFALIKKIIFFDPETKKETTYTLEFYDKKKDYYLSIINRSGKMDYFCDCVGFALHGDKKPCKHLDECMRVGGKHDKS